MNLRILVIISLLVYVANGDILIPAEIDENQAAEEVVLIDIGALGNDRFDFLMDSRFLFIWMCFSSAIGVVASQITMSTGKIMMFTIAEIKGWYFDPVYSLLDIDGDDDDLDE